MRPIKYLPHRFSRVKVNSFIYVKCLKWSLVCAECSINDSACIPIVIILTILWFPQVAFHVYVQAWSCLLISFPKILYFFFEAFITVLIIYCMSSAYSLTKHNDPYKHVLMWRHAKTNSHTTDNTLKIMNRWLA